MKNGKVDAKTKDFIKALENAGKETGERVWPMPLYQDYLTQLKSKVADLNNVGGRYAGSITAAKFLEQFTDSKPCAT